MEQQDHFIPNGKLTNKQITIREQAIVRAANATVINYGREIGQLLTEACQYDTPSPMAKIIQQIIETRLAFVNELVDELFPHNLGIRMTLLENLDYVCSEEYTKGRCMRR